jgi:hypothetical protein
MSHLAFTWNQLEAMQRIQNGVDVYDGATTPRELHGRRKTIANLLERGFIVRASFHGTESAWALTPTGRELMRRIAACAA